MIVTVTLIPAMTTAATREGDFVGTEREPDDEVSMLSAASEIIRWGTLWRRCADPDSGLSHRGVTTVKGPVAMRSPPATRLAREPTAVANWLPAAASSSVSQRVPAFAQAVEDDP